MKVAEPPCVNAFEEPTTYAIFGCPASVFFKKVNGHPSPRCAVVVYLCRNGDDLFGIESLDEVTQVGVLPVHHDRTDDERYGERELRHHERPSKSVPSASATSN